MQPLGHDLDMLVCSLLSAVGAAALCPFIHRLSRALGWGRGSLPSIYPQESQGAVPRGGSTAQPSSLSPPKQSHLSGTQCPPWRSLFSSLGRAEGKGGQHAGMAWELSSRPSDTSVHAQASGEPTRELGRYPSELPTLFPAPSPPSLALLGCPRTAPSRSSLAWGLCGASQRQPKGPGGWTVSSEESLDDQALGCQGTAEKLGAWPHWAASPRLGVVR